MFRSAALGGFPSWYVNDACADWSLFVFLAERGEVGYIDEVMATYRQHSRGFWTGLDRAGQEARLVQFYENIRSHLPQRYAGVIDTELVRHRHELALALARTGDRHAAERELRKGKWLFHGGADHSARLRLTSDEGETVQIEFDDGESENAFDVQLNHPCLKVVRNREYTVHFRARADRPRTFVVGFAKTAEPWSGLGLYKKVDATADWQRFAESFVALENENNGRIHFDLASSRIGLELDDVRLQDELDGTFVEQSVPHLHAAEADDGAIESVSNRQVGQCTAI
jgi:hypothetical protein